MWKKRGRLFEPAGQATWVGTHASLPTVLPDADGSRVFVSSRDRDGRSHIGFCDIEWDPSPRVVRVSAQAVLSPGVLGAFDDAGVTPASLVRTPQGIFLYYTGWSLGVTVPFYLQAGLAVSRDGEHFERMTHAPLLDRTTVDPFLTASPWVLHDGAMWRMWYVSGTGWEVVAGAPRHRYHVRYAESSDGLTWSRTGVVCLDYATPEEYAFGRPCVLFENGRFRMWFSVRGDRYRLGYAESDDGRVWIRDDELAGLDVSAGSWDSEMITYPVVFRRRGRLHMLYNGSGYGRTGFGLAEAPP